MLINEGYASVYNIEDKYNDILTQGVFKDLDTNNIKYLWQHDNTKSIGVINNIKEDGYGLRVNALIRADREIGQFHH